MQFQNLYEGQKFHLDTKHGRVTFIKDFDTGIVIHSEHYFFDIGTKKAFKKHTQIKIN